MDSSAPSRIRVVGDALALALLVGLTAWLSLSLARLPGSVAVVWVGNGIFVGWLLSRPTRSWPAYLGAGFIAELLVRLLIGEGLSTGSVISLSNLIEVVIVAGIIRRRVPNIGDPKGWLSLGGIATTGTLVACAVSGLLAAGIVTVASGTSFPVNFVRWYSAHVVGIVVVATLTVIARREGLRLFDAPGRRWDLAGCMLLLAAVSAAVFFQNDYPFLFLTFPPLLLGAFRHRFAGVVVGVTLLAVIASVATALSHGPLVMVRMDYASTTERIILLQVFIGTACLLTFPVALAMAERSRLAARVRDSEQRYRMLADYSQDVVVRLDADGRRLYVSPSAKDMLGWTPAEILDPALDLVHPEDVAIRAQLLSQVTSTGQPGTATYRARHKDGHYLWVEIKARQIPNVQRDGERDLIFAARDVSQRVAAQQALLASQHELETQARIDSLTGLANRRQFDERLALALTRLQRQHVPVALMYLDIDHFKQINDSLGHAAGDEVLRTFAKRLIGCVRAGDLVARMGGDEFVVLIEDAALPDAATVVARKLIAVMAQSIAVDDATIIATTSIGIAYAGSATVPHDLMEAADAALYIAKHAGRNRFHMVTLEADVR